jgi:hypothetical protein
MTTREDPELCVVVEHIPCYVKEHINPYTHAELRRELESLGLEVLDCRFVGGSEMIFKARLPVSVERGAPGLATV